MKNFKQVIMVGLLLLLSVVFIGCNNEDYAFEKFSNAYITLDINPSIEIITDDNGLVEQVNGLNDDGIKLLVDADYITMNVNEVLDAILELALAYGYLDFDLENVVLIAAATNNLEESDDLEIKVSMKVQEFIRKRNLKMEILKTSLEAADDIKEIAAEYNISVGKVKVIFYAMAIDSELTMDVAASMSIKDLNSIIKEDRQEIKEFYSEEVRGDYRDAKEQLKFDYQIALKGLINTAIQAADDEVFLDVMRNSDASVLEVKELYQQYYDELSEAKIPPHIEDTPNQDEMHNRIRELRNEYVQHINRQRGGKKDDRFDEDFRKIAREMKELEMQLFYTRKDRSSGFTAPRHNYNNGYSELFADLNINLKALEDLFMGILEAEITELNENYRAELIKIQDTFKADTAVLREQIKEENQILRRIWKR